MLKIARCTVDWRSIRDLNSGGATNALSHFECDPFDLLGNAPYVNLQKSFPEKGEKSRREQQILSCRKCADFNDNTMENQEEFPKCRLDFESISLRPLRYVCLFGFTACYMGNMVCALLHLTHSHIAHYSIPNLSPFVNQNSRCFCVGVGSKGESSWWRRMKTWRVFSVMDRPLCLGTV